MRCLDGCLKAQRPKSKVQSPFDERTWDIGRWTLDYSFFSFVCRFQLSNIQLRHFHKCLHPAVRLLSILVFQQLLQDRRHNLPRQTEFILKPAALNFLPTFRKLLPVFIHLLLGFAIPNERDCFGKFENRAAIKGGEALLPKEFC